MMPQKKQERKEKPWEEQVKRLRKHSPFYFWLNNLQFFMRSYADENVYYSFPIDIEPINKNEDVHECMNTKCKCVGSKSLFIRNDSYINENAHSIREPIFCPKCLAWSQRIEV